MPIQPLGGAFLSVNAIYGVQKSADTGTVEP